MNSFIAVEKGVSFSGKFYRILCLERLFSTVHQFNMMTLADKDKANSEVAEML